MAGATTTSPTVRAADGSSVRMADVCYSYPNGVAAVRNLSLDVPSNANIAIVGPSGCGKSTILSLVAGLLTPGGGSIDIEERDPARHPLTMVFQKDTLLPWLTVRQNVLLHFKFKKGTSAGIREDRLRELLSMAHLTDFQNLRPYELSGGMRRRAAFLSGVAPLPQLLMLDEPFSALDEPSRVALHQDVYEIVRSQGITTVLVTHDLAEAITLSDTVYILTSRPARVFRSYDIPFGHNRDMMSLREHKEFLELYGRLWQDLHTQIKSGAEE